MKTAYYTVLLLALTQIYLFFECPCYTHSILALSYSIIFVIMESNQFWMGKPKEAI